MTNAPSKNAQDPASATVLQQREWKTPVLDILALAEAQSGHYTTHDGRDKHRSG
jgi:hypothetical protein